MKICIIVSNFYPKISKQLLSGALLKLKKNKIHKVISSYGNIIKNGWIKNATKHKIDISVSGLDTILYLKFNYKNNAEIVTFFTQEMLKKGFLASNTIYVSTVHDEKYLNNYL